MIPVPPSYCIDTSSILVWFVEAYSPEIFPGLQTRIEELIAGGRLISPKAVQDEIRPGDACHLWCKAQAGLFIEEAPAVQNIVRQIMATHHNPQKPLKGISGADPFVIAMAKSAGPHCSVVADEHPGSAENRKIPFVCNAEKVPCINFKRLMLAEGWTFR
jgi:hypothetical protein